MSGLGSVRREIKKGYKMLKNWRAVGEKFGISGGMAYRIAVNGHEPKDACIRVKLGLPAIVPAPACDHCGSVHLSKQCPQRRKRVAWSEKPISDRPVELLRWQLENREEF